MAPPKVLVAEDDASVRMTIEFVLKDEGFEVLLAGDGEEAIQVAQASLPDVILLDQIMPKMDGKEVLTALRNHEATSAIPVLVLTGMARGHPEDWPGAHFVGKPFSPEALVQRIRVILAAK
ncbi:MAG: response regulator [Actinomycetota bacterium]|nr:response regulator [Actinomycetota bacterium]